MSLCDRHTIKLLVRRGKQGSGVDDGGFCQALHQKTVGNEEDPI
jgi:hypothetical protein